MADYFGTDGARGEANGAVINPLMLQKLGLAAGRAARRGDHRHRIVIGKDTRQSGYMVQSALSGGLLSSGVDVLLVGPTPTPAIGMLTRSLKADLGMMVTASHNPFQDNGVKLFGPDGYKIADPLERRIEALMDAPLQELMAPPEQIGSIITLDDSNGRYIEAAKATFPRDLSLEGVRIVIDCAHGAAYRTAPDALWELGADLVKIGVSPNGTNINEGCGSTDTKLLADTVVERRADIGIALDGDADRLIVIDERGQAVDGDQILARIAATLKQREQLRGGGVVGTVMSNLGLEQYLEREGLELERAKVGDRHVVARMRSGGYNLGGEQSGHIILRDHATTGDGLVAALQIMAAMLREGQTASEALSMFEPVPQLLVNVRFDAGQGDPMAAAKVREAMAEAEAELDGTGRLLVRKSGTEPIIRVMVEASDEALCARAAERVAGAVRSAALV